MSNPEDFRMCTKFRTIFNLSLLLWINIIDKSECSESDILKSKFAVVSHCVVPGTIYFGQNDQQFWNVPPYLSSIKSAITFEIKLEQLNCAEDSIVEIKIPNNASTPNVDFLPNGYFHNELESYHPSEYCIDRFRENEGSLIIRYCAKECTTERPCSSKCCPLSKRFSANGACQSDTPITSFANYLNQIPHYKNFDEISQDQLLNTPFHYTQGAKLKQRCNASNGIFYAESIYDDRRLTRQLYKIHLNGDLSVCIKSTGTWHKVNISNYCLDDKSVNESSTITTMIYCSHDIDPVQTSVTIEGDEIRSLIQAIFLIIASIFSLLTFVVYAFFVKQRNVHCWITMSLSATMFFAYIFLSTSYFIKLLEYHDTVYTFRCIAIGALAHFFFLSIFSWLTAVCFDLWWTFRTITPTNKDARYISRYLLHAAFGWGVPLCIVVLGLILEHSCKVDCESTCVTPGYGERTCYISNKGMGYYFYLPAGVLLLVNLLFFGSTFYKLYTYKKSTKFALQNTNAKRQMLALCLKLFFVMGIPWSLELLSWLISSSSTSVPWHWYVTDTLNIFQSVAIFIIFTCKKKTMENVRKVTNRFNRSAPTNEFSMDKETTVTLTSSSKG